MGNIQRFLIEALVGAFLLLFLCWVIGYFGNALYGAKFDLASCWGGFQALGGAGILSAVKYAVDSWPNSESGKNPYEGSDQQ